MVLLDMLKSTFPVKLWRIKRRKPDNTESLEPSEDELKRLEDNIVSSSIFLLDF